MTRPSPSTPTKSTCAARSSRKTSSRAQRALTVDGETADESEQQWWGYSVNGTFAELGVDSQPVADGDVYDFVLNVGW